MTTKDPIAVLDTIPADILDLLGQPPLMATEDASSYYKMLAAFARSIQPDDLITWMLVKDLADHRVEIARYRRMKSALIAAVHRKDIRWNISFWSGRPGVRAAELTRDAERKKGELRNSGKSILEIEKLKEQIDTKLAADIAKAEAESREQVAAWRNTSTTEADCVDLFSKWAVHVERIDILLHAAEARFSASLEEIDHHLRGLGRFLREQLDMVIEGELVESPEADGEPPKGGEVSKRADAPSPIVSGTPLNLSRAKALGEIGPRRNVPQTLARKQMTSELQVAANRENAKKSTGPKTRRGKSRASGNAVRHGLAGASFGPSIPSHVARLARTICNGESDPFRYEQALTIANSHILLARIRAARIAAIECTSKLASAIEGRAPIPASPLNRASSASEASDLADRPMPIDGTLEEMKKCLMMLGALRVR
jgi:hypothetical protein